MTRPAAASEKTRMAAASSSSEIAKKLVRQKFELDTDFLECPICTNALSSPVYQCKNGHTTCTACSEKITNCPSCLQPTGRIRNIAIEKLIESLQIECKHNSHGCNTMIKYAERAKHEQVLCEYRPTPCPLIFLFPDCTYTGPKAAIPMHMTDDHGIRVVECCEYESLRSARFRIKTTDGDVVVKSKEAMLMVSWYRQSDQGDSFHCSSITSQEVAYSLTVKRVPLNKMSGTLVYSIQKLVRNDRQELWDLKDEHLFVPGTSDEFEVIVAFSCE